MITAVYPFSFPSEFSTPATANKFPSQVEKKVIFISNLMHYN